ncbi:unnamed protein product, partial [Mesorhabditis belari]|uniref:Uncharacterized protein n=1 Tax=Mesorhabditis belari TaxID=2138241 RepID=A0AAF3J541_9BILA
MSFGYGIHDWLSHPQPGDRCSLNLNAKKAILAFLSFLLLLFLSIFEYFFIDKFLLVFPPPLVHAILFLFELLSFLLFIHSLFNEKPALSLPFCITQIIRSLVLFGVIIYYIIDVFQEEKMPIEHRNNNQIKWTAKLVGHLFFVLMGHIFLFYIGYSTYKIFSNVYRGPSLRKEMNERISYEYPTPACGTDNGCPRGNPGRPGLPGLNGFPGFPGQIGEIGLPGMEIDYKLAYKPGCRVCPGGMRGPPGIHGDRGPPGRRGLDGPSGLYGRPGEVGRTGLDGISGIPGMPGKDGEPGEQGSEGSLGEKGPKGVPGPPGPPGPKGNSGFPGIPVGNSGDEGPPGFDGIDGDPGNPGFDGFPGDDGVRGPPGNDATYCRCPDRRS